MAIPSKCKMPDLSDLKPLTNRLLIQLLIGDRGLSRKAALYRRNFVRLVDKALREYKEAREIILAQIAEANRSPKEMAKDGRSIYIITFPDHMETCINAVRRLYTLIDKFKSEKESPTLPKEIRRLVETIEPSIVDMRNAVEHIDEDIQKDEISPGEPIMMTVSKDEDGVVVSKYELKFEELAMVLRRMHEIALYILTIKRAT